MCAVEHVILSHCSDFIKKLKNSGKVNGIVVIHVLKNETLTPFPPDGFSPDKTCPNDGYGKFIYTVICA